VETILDDARSPLQVKVKEVDETDDIFTKLMGDVVEPRREFKENAPPRRSTFKRRRLGGQTTLIVASTGLSPET
jgi:hypothetical protein